MPVDCTAYTKRPSLRVSRARTACQRLSSVETELTAFIMRQRYRSPPAPIYPPLAVVITCRNIVRRLLRALLIALVVILIAIVGGAFWARSRVRASLPLLDGMQQLSGLAAPVRVDRDRFGI